jgi:hypothetical protein
MLGRPIARGVLPAVGVGAGLLPSILRFVSESHSDVSPLLLGNIAVVSLAAASVIIGCYRSQRRVVVLAPWLACGALIGAGLIGPLRIAPYVLVAASAFGVVAVTRGVGGVRGMLARTSSVLAAVLVNFACLWPFILGQYRPLVPAPYLSMDLRAHTLLADIPLHDVWIAHLSGGGNGRTLLDIDEAMAEGVTGDETVALAATIVAYVLMARVLGLASEECVDTLSLVRQRLTEADRARSIYRPGERGFVYHFESEALLEIQTCAAHALYAFALAREHGGYALYWGAYAKQVSWVTPYYMKLIDPVRRLVVYPSVLRRIEQRWRVKWRAGQGTPDASAPGGFGSAAESPGQLSW